MASKSPTEKPGQQASLQSKLAFNQMKQKIGFQALVQKAATKQRKKPPSQIFTTFKKEEGAGGQAETVNLYQSYNGPHVLSPQPQHQMLQLGHRHFYADANENKTTSNSSKLTQPSPVKEPHRETFSLERTTASGNFVAYACGPLKRPRYINERIEQELVEFKKEIEERFATSRMNKQYKFPLLIPSDEQLIVLKAQKVNSTSPFDSRADPSPLSSLHVRDPFPKQQQQHGSRPQRGTELNSKLISPARTTVAVGVENGSVARNLQGDFEDAGAFSHVLNDFFNIQQQAKKQITNRQREILARGPEKQEMFLGVGQLMASSQHNENYLQTEMVSPTSQQQALHSRNKTQSMNTQRKVVNQTYQHYRPSKSNNPNGFLQNVGSTQGKEPSSNQKHLKSSVYGNVNELLKLQSQPKRQKSTRYAQPKKQINFYQQQTLSHQKTQQQSRRVPESDPVKLSLDQNTFVRGSSNLGSIVTSTTNKDSRTSKDKGRRKSSRLSKGSRDKSNEKGGGVYKSLAINQDENPLNQAFGNVLGSSRNQSEFYKVNSQNAVSSLSKNHPSNQKVLKLEKEIMMNFEPLSLYQKGSSASNKRNNMQSSHQRTKTSYMNSYMNSQQPMVYMPSFDYRQVGMSVPMAMANLKSSDKKKNQTYMLSSDFKKALQTSKIMGAALTPNKYNNKVIATHAQ